MHIIIGLLTAIAGLIWALHSLQNSGVDLNSFNPFTWARRRRWQKTYGLKPLYNLRDSMDVAAVVVVGLLKQEGEISKEQKAFVLQLFQDEFRLDASKAAELFVSSTYLIKDELDFASCINKIFESTKQYFTAPQAESLMLMMEKTARLEGEATKNQMSIMQQVGRELNQLQGQSGKWTN